MVRQTYDILEEPKGALYGDLVSIAAECCASFAFVVRDEVRDARYSLMGNLSGFLVNEAEVSEWPGTRLIGHTARAHRYRVCDESIAVLLRETDRLYAWQHPERPEDLHFLRPDGDAWLATIAHERDAWLCLDVKEAQMIRERIPGLVLTPHRSDGPARE